MPREKARSDAVCRFEQILERAPNNIAAVQPLTSHLTNYPRKTNKTGCRSKDKLTSDILLWTPTHGHTNVSRPAKTYIHQLSRHWILSREPT